jgi:hypothetical protein
MSEETVEKGKGLEITMVFDEAATKVLDDMRSLSEADSNERLIKDAIRLYDWYLTTVKKDKAQLITRVKKQDIAVTFEF